MAKAHTMTAKKTPLQMAQREAAAYKKLYHDEIRARQELTLKLDVFVAAFDLAHELSSRTRDQS